ncbi:MAG: murein biosynthesis integral membrane protein MurJ [Anaerolineae bacterium]|nr:murein biosynthesis integral membrane protein MurJ [Anaerolineae bacterium]
MELSEPSNQQPSRAGQVGCSTLIVIAGTLLAFPIGLIRQRIVAGLFGTSAAYDAYTAADGLSELLVVALSAGTLVYAFMPVYLELLSKGNRRDANTLSSQVVNVIFLATGLAAALGALVAPTLVSAPWGIGPGYTPEIQSLTAQILQILLLSTIVFSISSIVTGILHARQHFWLPALAPTMYYVGIIGGAVVLAPQWGIFGLAWGAVLGALLHMLIQVPGLIFYKVEWRPVLNLKDPMLRRVLILMAPRVIDLLMARASITWINSNLASHLGEGRLSALSYAYRLMNIPWTLIGTALGFAIFPIMSALAAEKNVDAQRRALSGGVRAVLMFSIPSAVGLIALGRPAIRLLFEGGEFTAKSTELVFFALQFYVLALISQSLLDIVVRAFAAQQDTLTPLIVSFFTTAINVGLAIWLARPLIEGGLDHGGPALANGVAVGIEAVIGLVILHFRWKGIDARNILLDAGKALLAAAAMGLVIMLFGNILQPGTMVMLLGGGAIGMTVYFGLGLLLGITEIRTIPMAMIARLRSFILSTKLPA